MRLRRSIAAVSAVLLLLLAGCGNAGDQDEQPAGEAGAGDPAPTVPVECPERLPVAEGEPPPADVEAPTWPELTEGVVCTYDLGGDDEPTWIRSGEPTTVPAAALEQVRGALGDLQATSPDQICTADAGPRYLLVAASDEGTVALAADDFGCRDVSFTNDPASVPAGEGGSMFAPPGRFGGTTSLAELLSTL